MVKCQIEARGVKDPFVLKAMEKVPRHLFVPEDMKEFAYGDGPLPIGHGQTISQPYIVAFMTEALEPKGSDKVLEVGTGSGYQAAVLAEIVKEVFTLEIVRPLHERAEALLRELGYKNIHCRLSDGYNGWPEEAPFDKIIVTASAHEVPEGLTDQLKDPGRMILPVGDFFQELVLVTKENGKVSRESILPVRFVPLRRGKEK